MKRVWVSIVLMLFCCQIAAWGQAIVGPDQMNQCDQATYTTTITNASATQDACLLVITRSYTEAGILYVSGSTTITLHDATEYTIDPTANSWDIDAIHGAAYTLPPGESITLSYDLETTCAAVSGTEQVTVDFEDCADPGVPLQNISSTSTEILPGAIVISKTPSVQDASVGDLVTWTITVENTGLGWVKNVEISDVLGPGLAFSSATDGGSNSAQTTTWDEGTTPALALIAVGDTVSVNITAELIACTGLYNDVDTSFGCGPADVCFDTAIDEGTATASLNLIVLNPDLSFDAPTIVIPYCSGGTQVVIPITNNGAGTARSVELCATLPNLSVTNVQGGATYNAGCFTIPDIAPAGVFNLTFDVVYSGDWCAGGPSGTDTFELTYANDCGIPFLAIPQFSTISSGEGPSLAVTKTGPDSLRLGETGSYNVTVDYAGDLSCYGGSPEPVTIVDTYPEGFTVIDPAGGTVDGVARTITWAGVTPPFDENVQLQAPTGCGYCAQPGGGTDANTVSVTATDCCGCLIIGEASADTTILCEGYGNDVAFFSSTMELDRTTTVRCSADYAVTVTHTYTFIDDPALDDFLLNEFTYFVDLGANWAYVGLSASVAGATLGTVPLPGARLELPLTNSTSVRGKTIIYTYTLSAQDLESASCQATTYAINAGIDLIGTPTAIGFCGTMYSDPPGPSITAQPPAMSVSIDGIPVIQEYCATYDVTITLTRTSALAKPYDARLVLTNNGGSILDMSQAVCGGTVSSADGTTCTAPIEGASTYEWRFADLFDIDADEATITFPVTVPCSGPLADLSVVATFDDLCHDDTVYDDTCSTSSSDEASLSLSADVYTRKSPEILYATTRDVEWSVVVQNTGNGTAYNVWVDDVLGSGLVFDEANTLPVGATVTADLDHTGAPINGASFLFDELAPGELKTITFAAELIACDGLTNDIAASWGCGGGDCQLPRTDDSLVVIPPANLVATSYSPTPLPMCTDNSADVTVKNAGVTTVYNIIDTVTLPVGLTYLGNPEVQVNGGGWSATGEPAVSGQTLTWTQTETPALAEADPNDIIEIRFDYTVDCGFEGGDLEFQATYEDPCGETHPTNIGRFALGVTPADVTVTLRQTSPAAGDPIDCGSPATWEIDVENVGSSAIPVVEVEAILGDGLTYISSQGDPTYGPADDGSNVGQGVFWELTNLPIDAIATLQVTATSAAGGLDCEAMDIDVNSAWGCGAVDGLSTTFDADCTTSSPASGSISATRQPPLDLSASLSPGSIEGCDATTTLTLSIQNTGTTSTTLNVDIAIDLPTQLTYTDGTTEIDCGGGFAPANNPGTSGQTLTWYDIASEGGASDACPSIAPGETIQLRFDVDVSCYFTTQDIPIDVYSYDCCGLSQYTASTAATLTSLAPSLTIDKSPVNTTLDCYDAENTATWTITVENTGAGTADWIRITDTLGSSLVLDSSDSPSAGAGVSMGANVIGWEIGPLAPAETFTATVTAHLDQPSNDCALSIRRNTAAVLWGCGALDGDPNTTAEATCDIGSTIQDQANIRVPNLSISPSDITPTFTCSGDGVAPSSGEIELVVRNTGDGDVTADFEITLTEATTGYSVSDRFTNLGGTLPLAAGTSQTLTFSGWDVGCSDCEYTITAALDFLDEICECQEDDNLASLPTTITLPDLVIESEDLAVTCNGDGQLRIQGPVTVRNDGCGDPVSGTLRFRYTLFDGAGCTGNQIDTFTQDWTSASIASDGGTEMRAVDVLRSLDLCSITQVSVLIEVDDNDVFCECSGANNTLCAGTFALALPDLSITSVAVNVPDACNVGSVDVTIDNLGSGDAPAGVVLRISGDATGEVTTPAIASGASAVVNVPLDGSLTCGPKNITVAIDPDGALCECSDDSNSTDVPFTVSDPDLAISDLQVLCQLDGTVRVTATVTNNGDEASGDVVLRVLVDGTSIDTSIVSLDPAQALPIHVMTPVLSCGIEHTIRVDVDNGDAVCECDESNNSDEADITCPCPALSVDKIVTDISRSGSSIGITGPVEPGDVVFYRYTITNVGGGTAYNVDFTDTLPAGMVIETDAPGDAGDYIVSAPADSGSLALTDGVSVFSTSVGATLYAGETLIANYGVRVTTDIEQGTDLINVAATTGEAPDGSAIPGENAGLGDTSDGDTEDPDADDTGITVLSTAEPALSVDKTITDIVRGGSSIGISGPVEPGDIVFYRYVITNVGVGTAYDVEFTDTLPPGMVTETDSPGDAGSYTVTDPSASGSLSIPDAVGTFTTAIDAIIAGGETLTADFSSLVTSAIEQGVDLVNTAETTGIDGFGSEIPNANPATGDTSDGDAEDPDADDTGIAVIGTEEPALSVDKIITDILRQGSSLGTTGPVEPGDIVFYRYTISNVGLGTAYGVEFTDTLPTGMVTETNAPGDAGSYIVSSPSASGTLAIPDSVGAFTTSIGAVISGGETLIADYVVLVTSDIEQGTDLINVAAATGLDGAGNPIPRENADLGDTTDGDAEDPDADDTGITVLGTREPALMLDKRVTDVIRGGVSISVVDPVLYYDIIEYTVTIRNVGLGTAYAVEFDDTIPAGLETKTSAPGNSGSYTVTSPSASGSLALAGAVSAFSTSMNATIDGGGTLTAVYTVLVTPSALPGVDLVNTVSTAGVDGAGTPIPEENATTGDTSDDDVEDPDADDTGIASVRVGAPALVTRKSVVSINRQGTILTMSTVEPGDIVTYEVGISNVGTGPAQAVDLVDTLPAGFLYEGNPSANWPSGTSTADPAGVPGPTLSWTLNADLEPGEELTLQFDAFVTSDIEQGGIYTNTVTAAGEDPAGVPIPPDHSTVVPEDDDPDDTSDVSLVGTLPALVTDKSVLTIIRNGSSQGPESTVQAGDIVVYRLEVANVGLGTAYDVDVRDTLPNPFVFEQDSTTGIWPYRIGDFKRNPTGAPGPMLLWDTDATLESGDQLVMTFRAAVDGAVAPGNTYTNVLQALGVDGAGSPIPPNRAGDVPGDTDPDDRDEVALIAVSDAPALVTTKRVTEVIRAGNSVTDTRIEEGDIVEYEITVRNVGTATAYDVNLSDRLPVEFGYIDDTTTAAWPLGNSFADPSSGFSELQWSLDATLRSGDQVVLRFLAFVLGPIYDGSSYTNTMKAEGRGPDGAPIPEDQRSSVPGDIDPDDASQVTLVGRSSYVQGEGGLVAVPILRKTAEVVSESGCEAWSAEIDRLWFQTDIAMYAAAEFEYLQSTANMSSASPNSLLPTWFRTVRNEAQEYAIDNLLQVIALSSIGVGLTAGPLARERAHDQGTDTLTAVDRRLHELAARAGITLDGELPASGDWIYLEYEAGEPIFESHTDGLLGPSGTWTVLDQDIVPSALGMGLVKQVIEAETLLASSEALDRFVGWALVEIISNKILALETTLTVRSGMGAPYVPHESQWDNQREEVRVSDSSSTLFDQLSLLWGLSLASEFVATVDAAWPASETALRRRVADSIDRLLIEVIQTLERLHLTEDQTWLGRTSVDSAEVVTASTVDLGLLLVAIQSALRVVEPDSAALLNQMVQVALQELISRQDPRGRLSADETENGEDLYVLSAQLAGIRGLLVGAELLSDDDLVNKAQAGFDALDLGLWNSQIGNGLYASRGTNAWQTYCYTPLDIGLAVGALRELASESGSERAAHILARMSGFVRTIVDEAGLQLSNVIANSVDFARDAGLGTLSSIQVNAQAGSLAPVLQQQLCLTDLASEDPCGGWISQERDPWYQTDISMFAAYMLQDRVPGIEDYADANLSAVTLHSGLGVRFDEISSLRSIVSQLDLGLGVGSLTERIDPIAIPYAGGSPLISDGALAWNPTSFDTRIIASAQGMTLLREAQEAHQLLDSPVKEPHEQLQESLLFSSILQKLIAMQQWQIRGPGGVNYIPHALQWNETAGLSWTVLDSASTTFDQLALLFGLAEAYSLLADERTNSILNEQPFPSADWGSIALRLLDDVLRTLEVAHLDPVANVLVDRSEPTLDAWVRESELSTKNLGLLASAFDHVLAVVDTTSAVGSRTLTLLQREIDFLVTQLPDARGGVFESWSGLSAIDTGCDEKTLSTQLAALRALQVGHERLGLEEEAIEHAFRIIDARFWDPLLGVYRDRKNLMEWCVTPLDVAITVDALSRMHATTDGLVLTRLEDRFNRHLDRVLDGIPLQLPWSSSIDDAGATALSETRSTTAPVFDARACLRPSQLNEGTGWAEPGDTIRYTVTAENATDQMFYNLELEDQLPKGVSLLTTEPVADVDGSVAQWKFDELAPDEERTWQLLARVDETTETGEILQNCATLTYENAEGEPQPEREACADVEIQSTSAGLSSLLDSLDVDYHTDESMHLATALSSLACNNRFSWQDAELAQTLSDANLGILLAESGLGIDLFHAPQLAIEESPEQELQIILESFASSAGLSGVPFSSYPLFLPYESGDPFLANDGQFTDASRVITPAALGWTLAREAQFMERCIDAEPGLAQYLSSLVEFTIDSQLSWIAASTLASTAGNSYLPQAIRATITGQDVDYSLNDGRSMVYEQASLLYGLLAVAERGNKQDRVQRLAEQLAGETIEQLSRHWDAGLHSFVEPLETNESTSPASWYDHGIAMQALQLAHDGLPRERTWIAEIMLALGERAMLEEPERQTIDEAGRILTLLLAADITGRQQYSTAATSAWLALLEIATYPNTQGLTLSPQAVRGWGHTPGQLAIVFDVLGQFAQTSEQRAPSLQTAGQILRTNVVSDGVQLTDARGYWITHTQAPCWLYAPVFAQHRGDLPAWLHLLP